jgi:hypothetical protein
MFFLQTDQEMNLQVVSLTQLGITNQQLCTTITMLHIRQSPRIVIVAHQGGNNNNNNTGEAAFASSNAGLLLERKSPPGYEESQMIAATRQRNLRKRASALGGLNNAPPPPQTAGVGESLNLNLNHLHHSPSTLSLPAELAGEESFFGGRAAAAAGKEDFDNNNNNNNNLFTATPPTLADAMSDRSSYHGRTRRSLPAELAGDAPRGRRAEMDSDRLSIAPTLVDDGDDDDDGGAFPDRSHYRVRPGFLAPSSGLGRARSRRWLEAHCAEG